MIGSLQARLQLGLLISVCLLLAVQWWVVTLTINDLVERSFVDHMNDDTEALLSSLSFASDGKPALAAMTLSAAYSQPFSGRYYAVHSGTETLWSRSLWDASLPIVPVTAGGEAKTYADGPQRSRLLLLTSGFRKQGHDLTIVVAYDLSPLAESRRNFALRYGAVSLAALLLLVVVQTLTVRSALKPLERVRNDVQRLHSGQTTVLAERSPREIAPLVREINSLVATVERRLQRSRHAVGDLAHALKTPLAVLTQLVDHPTIRADDELHGQIRRHIAAIHDRMHKELARARLAGAGHTGSHFRVAEELPALCRLLEQSHSEKQVTIDVRIPPELVLPLDHEDMLELLGNVLDNACKWATRRVRVSIASGVAAMFTVEDDGPGCPPEQREQLTQRGVRLDESVAGHGLGLAIVKQIVDDYDGQLQFDTSPEMGGMRVRITLPTALP